MSKSKIHNPTFHCYLICVLISNDKIATTLGECHDCTRRRGISEINMIRSLYMVGTNFLEIQSSRIGAHLD